MVVRPELELMPAERLPALAVCLAAGLDGIEKQLTPPA